MIVLSSIGANQFALSCASAVPAPSNALILRSGWLSDRRQVDSDSLSVPSNVSKLTGDFSYECVTIQRILQPPREWSPDLLRSTFMAYFNPQHLIGPSFRTGEQDSPIIEISPVNRAFQSVNQTRSPGVNAGPMTNWHCQKIWPHPLFLYQFAHLNSAGTLLTLQWRNTNNTI